MKVGVYSYHHYLPFWHSPKNPDGMFNPTMLEGWTYQKRNGPPGTPGYVHCPAVEHWIVPILNGLFSLQLKAMAHVSIIFDFEKQMISLPKRVWVQITTEPKEQTTNTTGNIPIVAKDGIVQVEHLWGGDNKTYHPYQLLDKNMDEETTKSPVFWEQFFLSKLCQAKANAVQEAEDAIAMAREILETYSVIP